MFCVCQPFRPCMKHEYEQAQERIAAGVPRPDDRRIIAMVADLELRAAEEEAWRWREEQELARYRSRQAT